MRKFIASIMLKCGYVPLQEEKMRLKTEVIRRKQIIDKWQYPTHRLDAVSIEQIRIGMENKILEYASIYVDFDLKEKDGIYEFNASLCVIDPKYLKIK